MICAHARINMIENLFVLHGGRDEGDNSFQGYRVCVERRRDGSGGEARWCTGASG